MRVLLAAHQTRGGIGTLARGLAQALPSALGPDDRLDVELGWGDRRLRESRIGRFAFEQGRIPFLARKHDLLHLCDHRPVLASPSRFLLTIHDVFFLDDPDWYPAQVAAYKRIMLDIALAKHPAQIVCVSSWTRERLLQRRPRIDQTRVVVVPSGISEPEVMPKRGESDRPYFLTVSTIEPRKNYLRVLAAFRHARSKGLELEWRVVGMPGYGADPIVAELGAEPGVRLCGRVSDAEREQLYAGSLFAVTPSLAEGFGFPPLEAMVRGVPVICSRGSALDEVVGDAALRVDPNDDEGWAAALLTLAADDDARSRLSAAGRDQAGTFTWERCAEGYVGAYRRALAPSA
jgi:glycosyltransferase involved in cell wall biosynthesis